MSVNGCYLPPTTYDLSLTVLTLGVHEVEQLLQVEARVGATLHGQQGGAHLVRGVGVGVGSELGLRSTDSRAARTW